MTRAAVIVASVAVLCLTRGIDARAEPIRIAEGSLVFTGPGQDQAGPLSLVGNRGFSVAGAVEAGETLSVP